MGAFDRSQSERILAEGLRCGMRPKLHADEFSNLGGIDLACELHAVSIDHLDVSSDEEIQHLAGYDVVAVVLPAVNFNLGSAGFARARTMADSGVCMALATDLNPGSAPCPSVPLVMAISSRYQRLLPAEALSACTINAAHALGLGHSVGSLEIGKRADLLILSAPDYRYLSYEFGSNLVDTVIIGGRVVWHKGSTVERRLVR
jgi:imidazolonepropionase